MIAVLRAPFCTGKLMTFFPNCASVNFLEADSPVAYISGVDAQVLRADFFMVC